MYIPPKKNSEEARLRDAAVTATPSAILARLVSEYEGMYSKSMMDDVGFLPYLMWARYRAMPFRQRYISYNMANSDSIFDVIPDGLAFNESGWTEAAELDDYPAHPYDKTPADQPSISNREAVRRELRRTVKDWDTLNLIFLTMTFDPDNPTQLRYYTYNKFTESYREQKMGLVKFCNMLNRKHGFKIPDDMAQTWSENWGVMFREPEWEFNWADSIEETYHEEYFGSCMHGKGAVGFYDYQENVRMLELRDEEGNLKGRALVWHNVQRREDDKWQGKYTVMDRVYPSDGGIHEHMFAEHADEMGWIRKEANGFGYGLAVPGAFRVQVDADHDRYPYMDTFCWGWREGIRYYLGTSAEFGVDQWQYTDNTCPWDPDSEEYYDEDDDYYDED